jgi:hypothetical protein
MLASVFGAAQHPIANLLVQTRSCNALTANLRLTELWLWRVWMTQDEYVLEKVKRGRVTEEVLATKLTSFIDQMDHDQALDLAMKIGVAKQAVFLGTRQEQGVLKLELHSPCCVLQMLQ